MYTYRLTANPLFVVCSSYLRGAGYPYGDPTRDPLLL